jgi:hypothetical protein
LKQMFDFTTGFLGEAKSKHCAIVQ